MDAPDYRDDLVGSLPMVRPFLCKICDDGQQVDDLSQDVAVAYLEQADKPPTPDYLMAIACNSHSVPKNAATKARTSAIASNALTRSISAARASAHSAAAV